MDNKPHRQTFLDDKTNPRKRNIYGLRRHDVAMHDLLNSTQKVNNL